MFHVVSVSRNNTVIVLSSDGLCVTPGKRVTINCHSVRRVPYICTDTNKNQARLSSNMVLILSLESSQGAMVAVHRQFYSQHQHQRLWNLSLSPDLWFPTVGNTDHSINQARKAELWSWAAYLLLMGHLNVFSGSTRLEVYTHIYLRKPQMLTSSWTKFIPLYIHNHISEDYFPDIISTMNSTKPQHRTKTF